MNISPHLLVQQTTFLSVHDHQYILYPHIHGYTIQELTNRLSNKKGKKTNILL